MRGKQANSFCEWVVGANYSSRKKVSTATHKAVVANLSWQTDEETDTDTIALSIPRGTRNAKAARAKKEKQVRFASTVDDSSAEDAKEVSVTDGAVSTDSASDAEFDSDCPCGKCTTKRHTLNNTLQTDKGASESDTEVSNAGTSTDASDGETEDEIDSDCPCGKCVSARERLKKMKQTDKKAKPETDAEIHAKHNEKKAKEKTAKEQAAKESSKASNESNGNGKGKNGKNKNRNNDKPGTEDKSGTAGASAASATGNQQHKSKAKNKQNRQNRQKSKSKSQQQDETSEEESDNAETTEEEPTQTKKGKKRMNQKKTKGGKTADLEQEEAEKPAKSNKKNKKSKAYTHPAPRRPDLLMPVNAQVLQVEHSVGSTEDPRPNAFYDAEHGIMRVYHGAGYGNVYGALYPKRYGGSVPLGVPHPSQNGWGYGFTPSHAPPPPAHVSPVPGNPWYVGTGTVQVPGPVTPKPKDDRAVYNESPSLRAAAKRDNNVVPFAQQTAKAANSGLKKNANVDGPGDIQGDQGSKDKAAVGDNAGADNGGNAIWSPERSQKLQQDLEALSRKNNGSKAGSKAGSNAGSQKNDCAWGGDTNAGNWFAEPGNDGGNNNGSKAGSQKNGNIWNATPDAGWTDDANVGKTSANAENNNDDNKNNKKNTTNDNKEEDTGNQNDNKNAGDDGYGAWDGDANQDTNDQNNAEASKSSPSNKPPSTGGNVVPVKAANGSPESNHSNRSNGSMPGAWPPSSGGNVTGPGDWVTSVVENGAGNVINAEGANSTGGFWDTAEGQKDLHRTEHIHW